MSEGTGKSAQARGFAALARDTGYQNNVSGFQRGGEYRQQANAIVHAPLGEARNHLGAAQQLHHRANK